MPTYVKIIRATDFMVATAKGRVDFEQSRRLLSTVASASTEVPAQGILLDMRGADAQLSATQLWRLAAELGSSQEMPSGKIAVVCRLSQTSRAAFFALCAQNRGLPVNEFSTFEDAVKWLSVEEDGALEMTL
jgi:hypothetical protein